MKLFLNNFTQELINHVQEEAKIEKKKKGEKNTCFHLNQGGWRGILRARRAPPTCKGLTLEATPPPPTVHNTQRSTITKDRKKGRNCRKLRK